MKVLVIGSGGREHALVRALKSSSPITEVLAAPGNPGMEAEATCHPVKAGDLEGLLALAQSQKVEFTLVGPEAPLVEGIVDLFESKGLKIFGPTQGAAELEGSKVFTKNFLKKYQIPTAAYEVFEDLESAFHYVETHPDRQWVVKVDGLAAGKGVYVTRSKTATLKALEEVFIEKPFGEQKVVLEEFLEGEELSFMALCDGKQALPLASSQDHKRLLEEDEGPNTGGMGAYSPAPLMDEELKAKVLSQIIKPTLEGMAREGHPFKGVLYAGLMIIKGEPFVLEYNVRFGDPEAQVILPRLEGDWLELFLAAYEGRLAEVEAVWKEGSAAVVVLASRGYPEKPITGDKILGLAEAEALAEVYYAGVKKSGDQLVTAGGRVLGVTGVGRDLPSALSRAYEAVGKVSFEGMQFRKDIGRRGLAKNKDKVSF